MQKLAKECESFSCIRIDRVGERKIEKKAEIVITIGREK